MQTVIASKNTVFINFRWRLLWEFLFFILWYKKPIFYFSPSIAISEIINYQGIEFPRWKNKFIVSSLKEKSLYLLDYDKEKNRIISKEKIKIGHRIRDLIEMPNGKILLITDDQKLITLSRSSLGQTSTDSRKISK